MMKKLAVTIGSLLILYIITGCKKPDDINSTVHMEQRKDTAGKRYLALGDSYTIGQSVLEEERFPFLTVSLLRQQQIAMQNPEYIATTGWTTADLQTAINDKEPLGIYDVVSLLIGVNDQYRGMDTAGYRIRFTQLLQKAIQFTGNQPSHVFVLSIPDYSATPFVAAADKTKVSRKIDQFNAINKQITLSQHITYIDITPLTKAAANDPSLLASDGLHYSGKEHWLWAQQLAPLIKSVLQ